MRLTSDGGRRRAWKAAAGIVVGIAVVGSEARSQVPSAMPTAPNMQLDTILKLGPDLAISAVSALASSGPLKYADTVWNIATQGVHFIKVVAVGCAAGVGSGLLWEMVIPETIPVHCARGAGSALLLEDGFNVGQFTAATVSLARGDGDLRPAVPGRYIVEPGPDRPGSILRALPTDSVGSLHNEGFHGRLVLVDRLTTHSTSSSYQAPGGFIGRPAFEGLPSTNVTSGVTKELAASLQGGATTTDPKPQQPAPVAARTPLAQRPSTLASNAAGTTPGSTPPAAGTTNAQGPSVTTTAPRQQAPLQRPSQASATVVAPQPRSDVPGLMPSGHGTSRPGQGFVPVPADTTAAGRNGMSPQMAAAQQPLLSQNLTPPQRAMASAPATSLFPVSQSKVATTPPQGFGGNANGAGGSSIGTFGANARGSFPDSPSVVQAQTRAVPQTGGIYVNGQLAQNSFTPNGPGVHVQPRTTAGGPPTSTISMGQEGFPQSPADVYAERAAQYPAIPSVVALPRPGSAPAVPQTRAQSDFAAMGSNVLTGIFAISAVTGAAIKLRGVQGSGTTAVTNIGPRAPTVSCDALLAAALAGRYGPTCALRAVSVGPAGANFGMHMGADKWFGPNTLR